MSDVADDENDVADDENDVADDESDVAGDDVDSTDDARPETRVPDGEEPLTCPYCGFDLPEETGYRLHLGLEHYGRLDEAEQEVFKESYRSEEDALNRFRIIALGGLVLLYFGFLVVYALLAA